MRAAQRNVTRCIDAGIESDLRDARLDVADPSDGFLTRILIEERDVCRIA